MFGVVSVLGWVLHSLSVFGVVSLCWSWCFKSINVWCGVFVLGLVLHSLSMFGVVSLGLGASCL